MATGTFYLRPSADISLGHPVYPETLAAGYLAINEKTSDGLSTYIGFSSPPGQAVSYTSKFEMTANELKDITNITSVYLGGESRIEPGQASDHTGCNITIYVSNKIITTIESYVWYASDGGRGYVYQDGTLVVGDLLSGDLFYGSTKLDYTKLINTINDAIALGEFPSIAIEITNFTESTSTATKNGGVKSYVSQVYLQLECEYGSGLAIHTKQNDTWLQAQKAYQKQSGTWVEITEDDCKGILQSNLIVKSEVS